MALWWRAFRDLVDCWVMKEVFFGGQSAWVEALQCFLDGLFVGILNFLEAHGVLPADSSWFALILAEVGFDTAVRCDGACLLGRLDDPDLICL